MIYRFGDFTLDLDKVELRSGDTVCPIEPQVFALLALLVENRERLVSKDEIFEVVWDGRLVSDSALASRIKSARKVLGDDGRTQRFIRTARGQGFRFVARVRVVPDRPVVSSTSGTQAENVARVPIPAAESMSRPSIAILPFRLIGPSGDVGPYAVIADGLPHELIAELARLRWLFVVARGSSFRLRDDELDLREVGNLLGVRYCLSGTVELTGRHLVVTTILVDTRTGGVVWGERYSGFLDEVHEVRKEIRSSIVASLEIQIPAHEAEAARLSVSCDLDAWSAYHLGLHHAYRFNHRDNLIAGRLFGRAIAEDPEFARAHAGLSFVHFQTAFMRRTDDVEGETALARSCSQRAVDLDPLDPFANYTMGRSYWLEADLGRALDWIERSTALNPNFAQGFYAQAWTETMAGNDVQGREHVDFAMELSPLDPMFYAMAGTRAFTHLMRGEDVEAAAWATRAARSPGAHVLLAMIATAAQKLVGNEREARKWSENVRSRNARLTRDDFFLAFPVEAEPMRTRVAAALQALGF